VFSFTSSGFIISLFIVTEEGVMVIDPMKVEHAKAMLEEIRRITQAPIKYLFYSHDHWDHTIGGQVFKDQGATIVSHIDAYDWIKANPTEDLLLPDETWVGSKASYTLGDVTLDLHHEGLSHGSGMTTFVLPKSKVGYIADLVSPKAVGYQFLPDFHIPGLLNTLEKITEYEVDTIVFAHNGNYLDPLETGDKDTVRFAIQYYKDLQSAVREELKKGTPFFLLPDTVKLPKYSNLSQFDKMFPLNVMRMAAEESLGPLGWKPETPRESQPSVSPSTFAAWWPFNYFYTDIK